MRTLVLGVEQRYLTPKPTPPTGDNLAQPGLTEAGWEALTPRVMNGSAALERREPQQTVGVNPARVMSPIRIQQWVVR